MEQREINIIEDKLCVTRIHPGLDTNPTDAEIVEIPLSEQSIHKEDALCEHSTQKKAASKNSSKGNDVTIAIDENTDTGKQTSSKQVFTEFCFETTAHGFSHAANEKEWTCIRFMWIFVILLANSLLYLSHTQKTNL